MTSITPSPTSSPALFGQAPIPPHSYRGMVNTSFHLPMRDGVRLAVDLYLPRSLPSGERIPALLVQTRYWRSLDLNPPFRWLMDADQLNRKTAGFKPFFVERGYAMVLVDVRGTGASFGEWPYPWHPDAVQDGYDLVEWIIRQPWSNGRVGAYGVSYLGVTAEFLCSLGHPAVRAVIPQFNQPDPYTDIALPGGVFNARFINDWGRFSCELDENRIPTELGRLARWMVRGVKPVDDDLGGSLLRQAIQAHATNTEVYNTAFSMEYRDCVHPSIQACVDDMAVARCLDQVEQSGAAIFGWGSWMDAGTADAALRRFATLKNARRVVIGAWEHGGQSNASPYLPATAPVSPSLPAQWAEMLQFFDAYLKDTENGVREENLVHYYTLGKEAWQRSPVWPPPGVQPQRWHLAGGGRLLPESPDSTEGQDIYPVDFAASTGDRNRWWELSGALHQTVEYRHRDLAARHLQVYLTPPLEHDLEIAGSVHLNIYLSSNEPDGILIAYLEDVDPSGKTIYLAEGELRLIHRRLELTPGPYRQFLPVHSYRQADAFPMPPGEVVPVVFGMLPVSAFVRRGHCLRLGFAGHDQGTFLRLPAEGQPVYAFQRNRTYPSFIEIPILSG
jgi:hypothetical protein